MSKRVKAERGYRPITRAEEAARSLIHLRADPYYYSDWPMGGIPRALALNANTNNGRSYSQLDRFNTNNNKLYSIGVSATQAAANDTVYMNFKLPTVVNTDGTAILSELIKLRVLWPSPETATGNYLQQLYLYCDQDGLDNSYNTDHCYLMAMRRSPYLIGVESYAHTVQMDQVFDFTDGAGTGEVIGSDNMILRYSSSGFASGTTVYAKLIFKQRMVSTAAYVSSRNRNKPQ